MFLAYIDAFINKNTHLSNFQITHLRKTNIYSRPVSPHLCHIYVTFMSTLGRSQPQMYQNQKRSHTPEWHPEHRHTKLQNNWMRFFVEGCQALP